MVEDRLTEPTRIAALLASELSGLSRGELARVRVVDADRTVAPGADGPVAYRLAAESAAGDAAETSRSAELGTVRLFEDAVGVTLTRAPPEGQTAEREPGRRGREDLSIEAAANEIQVTVRTGAAVKPAVDVIEAVLAGDVADDSPTEA